MRKLFYLGTVGLLLSLTTLSCDKSGDITDPTGAATLTVNPDTLAELSCEAQNITFKVESNRTWSISADKSQEWCTCEKKEYKGNDEITFAITANEGTEARSIQLTLSTVAKKNEKVLTHTIKVAQKGITSPAAYIQTENAVSVGASQQEVEINVTSNTKWTVSLQQNEEWCSLPTTTEYDGDALLTLSTKANTSDKKRLAVLTLQSSTDSNIKQTVVITQEKNNTQNLKVVSWNIWKNNVSELGPEAMTGTIEILKQLDADVILTLETGSEERAKQIKDGLGSEYTYQLASDGYSLCIFSRYPIVDTYKPSGQHISSYNFLGVKVNVNGTHVNVYNAWLHYLPAPTRFDSNLSGEEIAVWEIFDTEIDGYSYGSRDEEMTNIIDVIRPKLEDTDNVPVILGGDLNSLSHLDWTEATKDMYGHKGKVVDWEISNIVTAAGLTDSYREYYPNPVTHPGTTHAGPSENEYNRIDYIYYKGANVRLLNSQAYRAARGTQIDVMGKDFFFGSDHGLVYSEFEIYAPSSSESTTGNDFNNEGEW